MISMKIENLRLRRLDREVRDEVEAVQRTSSTLTASLFTQIVDAAFESNRSDLESAIQLTEREKDVVDLIAEGLSNKEISARLHIATHTVKSHIHNILEKLALSTRLQIAAFARGRDPR